MWGGCILSFLGSNPLETKIKNFEKKNLRGAFDPPLRSPMCSKVFLSKFFACP